MDRNNMETNLMFLKMLVIWISILCIRKVWRYQRSIRIRIHCISKKGKQHNGQKKKDKRTNNHIQNSTQKTKDQATRTPLKPGMNSSAPEMLGVLAPLVTPVVLLLKDTNIIWHGKHLVWHHDMQEIQKCIYKTWTPYLTNGSNVEPKIVVTRTL